MLLMSGIKVWSLAFPTAVWQPCCCCSAASAPECDCAEPGVLGCRPSSSFWTKAHCHSASALRWVGRGDPAFRGGAGRGHPLSCGLPKDFHQSSDCCCPSRSPLPQALLTARIGAFLMFLHHCFQLGLDHASRLVDSGFPSLS